MRILNLLYKIFLFSFLSIIIIIIGLYSYSYFSPKLQLNSYHTYELYDIDENVFYEGNKNNRWTNINKISQNLKDAVVSVEDKNFYVHNGFDYLRIIKELRVVVQFLNNILKMLILILTKLGIEKLKKP